MPLQRRVAYLTTVAVALAVAVTSVAGYVTLRVSLYRALDTELVTTAAALARGPVVEDLRTIGNLTGRSVRSDELEVAAVRADGSTFFVPDESDQLVLGPDELAVARLGQGFSARSGASEAGVEYRIVAVPLSEVRRLRPRHRPPAGLDQRHPQLALGGADHLRGVRGGGRGHRRHHRGPVQPAAGATAVGRG